MNITPSFHSKSHRISKRHFVASVLQCSIYHCTSFEKNAFENFSILIFDALFITDLESYQRVQIYTYSVNDLDLKYFYSNMEFTGILQFADRTLCPRNRYLCSVL